MADQTHESARHTRRTPALSAHPRGRDRTRRAIRTRPAGSTTVSMPRRAHTAKPCRRPRGSTGPRGRPLPAASADRLPIRSHVAPLPGDEDGQGDPCVFHTVLPFRNSPRFREYRHLPAMMGRPSYATTCSIDSTRQLFSRNESQRQESCPLHATGRLSRLSLDSGARRWSDVLPMRLTIGTRCPTHWHLVMGQTDPATFSDASTGSHLPTRLSEPDSANPSMRARSTKVDSLPWKSRRLATCFVCRYVERNAVQPGLVRRAQDWPWASRAERLHRSQAVQLVNAPFLSVSSPGPTTSTPPTAGRRQGTEPPWRVCLRDATSPRGQARLPCEVSVSNIRDSCSARPPSSPSSCD